MNITKLVLNNYKRLFLNDITNIEYTPTSVMQIILGQNGSGKSSLLEQLTPLPPVVKKEFRDGGYKEITISHNDQTYTLRSGLGTGHSFVLEGTELNPGGTITSQLKLVEYHFGITPHIQQILLGKKQFTGMSFAERKKWVSDMSAIDYSYPIMVYTKLKQRHRDIVGGIKLLQNNIVKVKNTELPKEVIDKLGSDKKHLIVLIDHMLTLINSNVSGGDIGAVGDTISRIVDAINAIDIDKELTLDNMKNLKSGYEARLVLLNERLSELYKHLSDRTKQETLDDASIWVDKKKDILKKIKLVLGTSELGNISDIETVSKYLKDNYMDMVSLVTRLDEYSGVDICKDNLLMLNRRISALETKLYNNTKSYNKLEERIDHLKAHSGDDNIVVCPKCDNRWNPEYTSEEYDSCVTNLGVLGNDIGI